MINKVRNILIIVSIGFVASLFYVWNLHDQNQQLQGQISSLQNQLTEASNTAQQYFNDWNAAGDYNVQLSQKNAESSDLQSCLAQAQQSYLTEWAGDCTSYANSQNYQLQQCLNTANTPEYSLMQQQEIDTCNSEYGDADSSPTCALPLSISSVANDDLRQAKADCFQEYPQN